MLSSLEFGLSYKPLYIVIKFFFLRFDFPLIALPQSDASELICGYSVVIDGLLLYEY